MDQRNPRAISGYIQLRERVRQTLFLGQQRIEQEKVQTYWETGRLINEHIRIHNGRAEHGRALLLKLSGDLEIDESVLRRAAEFHRQFPIRARGHEFNERLRWSHYRALLPIKDDRKRLTLAERAGRHEWNAEELRHEIKKLNARSRKLKNAGDTRPPELLTPVKGSVYTYRLIRPERPHPGKTELRIDVGFSNYKEASMKGAASLKAGDIAVSEWVEGDTYRLTKAPDKTAASLFTYYAYIERVVDADTLFVQVDLGFGWTTRQYLRLRGIDAPEVDTPEGKRAKRFVESELSKVSYVTITSTRSDKYDRYLADVFYKIKSGEQFLNNRLLEERLAVRV